MSRKRKKDQESTDTTTTESTMPQAGTAVAEPPAVANDNHEAAEAANDNRPSFAERVGQRVRTSAADPFVIAADHVVGVRLYESNRDRQMAIKFEEKPSRAVLDKMRDEGWVWKQADKIWAHAITPDNAATTRVKAERLYQEVCTMLRQEIGAGQEIPF